MVNTRVYAQFRRFMEKDIATVRGFDPWTEDDYRRALRRFTCQSYVAEYKGQVVGFVLYEIRTFGSEIIRLGVHPDFRRRKVGTHLVGKLIAANAGKMALWVSEWNTEAHLFLSACGFRATSVERGHYQDTGADGYWFQCP
jgi:ribosomal-protein-alanine N-acetyltransferase